MNESILMSLAGIGILGILCQWIAWRLRLPAILFLLLAGILVGPVTGTLDPDTLFGSLLFPIVSLCVAVILFEGSLTLKIDEIRGLASVVRNLITIGTLITWVATGVLSYFVIGLPLELCMLFGALIVVTGPTVIMPMLRTIRPNAKITNVLKWEGITIDPLGALLAVLVFEFIQAGRLEDSINNVIYEFFAVILVGTVIGLIAAVALGYILRNHLLPEYLRNVFSLVIVFAVYAISDHQVHESGLLAVTVMGMTLANMPHTDMDDILDFKESLSLLMVSGLFIILAARTEFAQIQALGWRPLIILLAMMVIIRPAAVWLSSIGSDLNTREKILISWIGPRGIVAAAVAALFAIRLEQVGFENAELLVPLTFIIIIGTVVIQSATAKSLAKLLKVREPAPTGFLIIGAGMVPRLIAKTLQELKYKVIVSDSNWENTSIARMEGLTTYYGNPVSEHADRNLDLVGIGKMLALSGRGNVDSLASLRFRNEFGVKNIYELKPTVDLPESKKNEMSLKHRGQQLFGDNANYQQLANMIGQGAEIKKTPLSEEYRFEDFIEKNKGRAILMFAQDPKKKLHIFTKKYSFKPESGWVIISLLKKATV